MQQTTLRNSGIPTYRKDEGKEEIYRDKNPNVMTSYGGWQGGHLSPFADSGPVSEYLWATE